MPWSPSDIAHASLLVPYILLPLQKPPAYGTKSALEPVSNLIDGNIDTLLSFGNLLALGSLVHDATFEFHLSERLPVLSQILRQFGIRNNAHSAYGFISEYALKPFSGYLLTSTSPPNLPRDKGERLKR